MFNHTTVAKAVVTAACTLAIALLIIGMGVNSTWAASDPPFVRNFTPLPTALHTTTVTTADHHVTVGKWRFAFVCVHLGKGCSAPGTPSASNGLPPCCPNEGLICKTGADGWRCYNQ